MCREVGQVYFRVYKLKLLEYLDIVMGDRNVLLN